MQFDSEVAITVILVLLLLFFSLNADKSYAPFLEDAAKHPFARFLAGLTVAILAGTNPLLAILALLIVFFWIGNVHIRSGAIRF